jgi:hypothetical protein
MSTTFVSIAGHRMQISRTARPSLIARCRIGRIACAAIQIGFIASLKLPFKFSAEYPRVGKGQPMQCAARD